MINQDSQIVSFKTTLFLKLLFSGHFILLTSKIMLVLLVFAVFPSTLHSFRNIHIPLRCAVRLVK